MATETTAVTLHSRDAPPKRAWPAGAILAVLASALLSAAIWVPVTWYLTWTYAPCDFIPGSFAYEPGMIAPNLLTVMRNDEDIVKANGCNQCPDDRRAVWIAPGDICTLKDMPTAAFDHCAEPAWANDYEPSDHVKACLTAAQLEKLWRTGHCHDTNTTLPYVGKEGLLFCVSSALEMYNPQQPPYPDIPSLHPEEG